MWGQISELDWGYEQSEWKRSGYAREEVAGNRKGTLLAERTSSLGA